MCTWGEKKRKYERGKEGYLTRIGKQPGIGKEASIGKEGYLTGIGLCDT